MPLPDLDPGEAPLAELQDAPVELGGGQVERPGGHGLAVDPHPALGQAAPALAALAADGDIAINKLDLLRTQPDQVDAFVQACLVTLRAIWSPLRP